MRGKVLLLSSSDAEVGITPAYAGKRIYVTSGQERDRDHPRVCGEKVLLYTARKSWTGSPPRMRGKDTFCIRRTHDNRITPAYAGKRAILSAVSSTLGDHPRVCGEKGNFIGGIVNTWGSPPRMRGKGRNGQRRGAEERITPAYAGKRRKQQPMD